jgi:hypothetical protein
VRNTGDMKRSGVPQITGAKNSGSVHTATSAMVPSLALQSLATETGALKHMEKEVKGNSVAGEAVKQAQESSVGESGKGRGPDYEKGEGKVGGSRSCDGSGGNGVEGGARDAMVTNSAGQGTESGDAVAASRKSSGSPEAPHEPPALLTPTWRSPALPENLQLPVVSSVKSGVVAAALQGGGEQEGSGVVTTRKNLVSTGIELIRCLDPAGEWFLAASAAYHESKREPGSMCGANALQIWMLAADFRIPGGGLVVPAPVRLASDGAAQLLGTARLEKRAGVQVGGVGELAGLVIKPDTTGGQAAVVVTSGEWELTGCVVYGGKGVWGEMPAVLVCAGAVCHVQHCDLRAEGTACAVRFERGARGSVRSCVIVSDKQSGQANEQGPGGGSAREGGIEGGDQQHVQLHDNTWLPRLTSAVSPPSSSATSSARQQPAQASAEASEEQRREEEGEVRGAAMLRGSAHSEATSGATAHEAAPQADESQLLRGSEAGSLAPPAWKVLSALNRVSPNLNLNVDASMDANARVGGGVDEQDGRSAEARRVGGELAQSEESQEAEHPLAEVLGEREKGAGGEGADRSHEQERGAGAAAEAHKTMLAARAQGTEGGGGKAAEATPRKQQEAPGMSAEPLAVTTPVAARERGGGMVGGCEVKNMGATIHLAMSTPPMRGGGGRGGMMSQGGGSGSPFVTTVKTPVKTPHKVARAD